MNAIAPHESGPAGTAVHVAPARRGLGEVGSDPNAEGFAALRVAYQASGGLMLGDDLARLLEERQRGDFVSLARLVASGQVFGLRWQGDLWIPMFQFDPAGLTVRPAASQVLAELVDVFGGWELGIWFVHANSWLHDRCPVDLLDSSLPAVLEAARGDHFVAGG